jgi:hypothetical protein
VKISRFFHAPEVPQSDPAPLPNQENTSPQNRSTYSLRGGHRSSAPLGILQEISNSNLSRHSQKLSAVPFEEDNPERPFRDISPAVPTPGTCYHDASSTQPSPLNFHTADADFDIMKLREISGNERRSPASLRSPLARQVRGRKKQGLDLRKTTFEASEYIEHIENELQQVKEAMHSPNSGKPLQEKLKILQVENMQLKDTISDLEETFDERLKQAVEYKAAIEVEMRRRIKVLEEELVSKENIISDLEHDREESTYDGGNTDALRAMIDRLEQEKERLEQANRVVEKRNEALTGLLVQSPTRNHHVYEPKSPTRHDSRRTPRPKSIVISKVSSSPRPENHQRPQSVLVSPVQSSSGYSCPSTALKLEHEHPCNLVAGTSSRKTFDSQSVDSGLGQSWSARSPAEEDSRPSSMASATATSPSAWGLLLPASPSNDKATVRQGKHRRTRRFESGSTQLKPLLLPTMAAESHAFSMSYAQSPYSSPTRRGFSEQSPDPTIAFLSQPFETPIQRPALQAEWGSQTALKALEGSPEPQFETFEDIIARHDPELASFASSPMSPPMSGSVYDKKEQDSDPLTCVDSSVVAGDITELPNHPESRDVDEEMFSLLTCEASSTNKHSEGVSTDEHDVTSSCLKSSSRGPLEIQGSSNDTQDADSTPLGHVSFNRRYGLIPEPLSVPSALNKAAGASKMMIQRASPTLVSDNVDDSPIPRKRQRSSNPDSCSFTAPTLCINPAHEANLHRKSSRGRCMGPCNESMDTIPNTLRSHWPCRPQSPTKKTLHKRSPSPIPLTSVTIRAIFGTLSRYTSYVQEMRRDPSALARRVIANAWHSNWNRLGKLSWWVLGLFLGTGPRSERLDSVTSPGWDWDRYNGEAIAEEMCESAVGATEQEYNVSSQESLSRASQPRSIGSDESDPGHRAAVSAAKAKAALQQDNQDVQKQKPGWRKSLYLWGQFSVAIMLAVGGAVISGPEEMLRDCAVPVPQKTALKVNVQTVGDSQSGKAREEQYTPSTAIENPGSGMIQPTEANQTSVTESELSSEARGASDRSARSFCGNGTGSALGIVEHPRQSASKTPSPARSRRRAAASHLRASRRKCTFEFPGGNEDLSRFDDRDCGITPKTWAYSQSRGNITNSPV